MVKLLTRCWKNLRNIILYSDSEMVEFTCGIIIIYLATASSWDISHSFRAIFIFIGVIQLCALLYYDLGYRNKSNLLSMIFYFYLSTYAIMHNPIAENLNAFILTALAVWCWTRTSRELNN